MKRSIHFLKWANVLLVLVSLLAYLSPYVSPAFFWPLSFLGLIFPFLLLFNLGFVLFWALLKNRYFIFSLLTIIAGWGYIQSFIGFGSNQRALPIEGELKITSFNAHSIVPSKEINEERKKAYTAFSGMIANEQSQIFCFQEVPNLSRAIKKCRALKSNPVDPSYKVFQEKGGSLGILTNLPVLQTQYHYFDYRTNGYQWADIQFSSHQVIRVFNLHLQSNGISNITEEVASNGNLQDEKTWLRIKGIMGRYKRAAQKRAEQAEEIARAIQESPHPVIICGDFNDVPTSYAYRIISNGMQDSFKKKGGGTAVTYVGPIPGLRIDYIFVPYTFEISSFYTGKRNFSDHKPVSTIIQPRL